MDDGTYSDSGFLVTREGERLFYTGTVTITSRQPSPSLWQRLWAWARDLF